MSFANSSLLIKKKERKISISLIYVDDLAITGDDKEEIKNIRHNLAIWQMEELAELKHFSSLR